jgi:hypothetical protein
MTRLSSVAVLVSAALLGACEKNAVQDITAPIGGGAFIRFQNYAVGSPQVNFYANTQKITGVTASSCTPAPTTPNPACSTTGVEATTGVAYGGSANAANYSMLAPGQYTFSSKIAAATDNGLATSSSAATLAEGKFYTYFSSGIYNTTSKSADAFIVEDILPTSFDYTKTYLRVVNASSNAPTISVTAKNQTSGQVVTVATNVPYKSASEFATFAPGLSDVTVTFGTVTAVFTGVNFIGGHVLTLALTGDATSTVAANALTLRSVYNR